ncbi:hypothetical protein [Streptomyces sp. NPDC059071]|uniref:hypothetical protein n=1 Tax=unclassified Streptomyces TaxID=2593676 RepID=UPI003659389F
MEQRTGPSIQTVHGAAADPAFVPGITGVTGLGPVTPVGPEEPADAEPRDAVPADAAGEAEVAGAEGESEADAPEADADAAPEAQAPDADAAPDPDGPVFEAADRRSRIVADAQGVRLGLDEESCEFRWDEIGAVETATARFGKRFRVVVHTPDRRWYPIEIDAPAKARVQEWESLLDAVLDAYFDEGGSEPA